MSKIYKNVFLLIITLSCLIFLYNCTDNNVKKQHENHLQDGHLTLTPKVYDLGIVNKNEYNTIDYKFIIYNSGQDTLTISNIEASCNCIKIESYPDKIFPEEKDSIFGSVDLSNQSNHLNKSIYITYCDEQLAILRIKGDIIEGKKNE